MVIHILPVTISDLSPTLGYNRKKVYLIIIHFTSPDEFDDCIFTIDAHIFEYLSFTISYHVTVPKINQSEDSFNFLTSIVRGMTVPVLAKKSCPRGEVMNTKKRPKKNNKQAKGIGNKWKIKSKRRRRKKMEIMYSFNARKQAWHCYYRGRKPLRLIACRWFIPLNLYVNYTRSRPIGVQWMSMYFRSPVSVQLPYEFYCILYIYSYGLPTHHLECYITYYNCLFDNTNWVYQVLKHPS